MVMMGVGRRVIVLRREEVVCNCGRGMWDLWEGGLKVVIMRLII